MKAGIFPRLVFGLFLSYLASAALPGDWQTRQSWWLGDLYAVSAGSGQMVALGEDMVINHSPDGRNWYGASTRHAWGDFYSLAYGNGIFMAGGGSNIALALISTNGSDWTRVLQGGGDEQQMLAITFAQGVFVAVGGLLPPQSYGWVLVSTNGRDWRISGPAQIPNLRAVIYGNNQFVAVGDNGSIVTAPNPWIWTVRNSGTAHTLRAITFTGMRFVAGGDGATIVTSTDGINWSPAAQPPFNVRGLASSGDAVVAVGNFNNEGRLHTSPDGLTWPGNSLSFTQRLNAVMHESGGRFFAVGDHGLIVESTSFGDTPNSWTKTTSGYWEEPFWSLVQPPAYEHGTIMFTNAGWKALAIGSGTAANYPASLRLRKLTVDAPADSGNLLLLNFAGPQRPLTVGGDFTLGPNGSLLSHYSGLQARWFHVRGRGTFTDYGQSQFGFVYITNGGALTLSNGWFEADTEFIASDDTASFHQSGGTNGARELWMMRAGSYQLSDGSLLTSNTFLTFSTSPQKRVRFIQSAGEHRVQNLLLIDSGAIYDLQGGLLAARSIRLEARGELHLRGGSVRSNEFFGMYGGTLFADGEHQFGMQLCGSETTIDFQSGSTILRFGASGHLQALPNYIYLTNWTGSAESPGRDQLYIGTNDRDVGYQLTLIVFINPHGYPPGRYGARIKPTGEIVPLDPGVIKYTRFPDGLVLTWPPGYQLFSSQDAPYEWTYFLVTNATSPHTVFFTGPRRFFKLRYPPWF